MLYSRVCKCVLKVNANHVLPYQYNRNFDKLEIIDIDNTLKIITKLTINVV